MTTIKTRAAALALAAFACAPAWAGKADDTLRLAFQYPMSTVDSYADFKPEMEMLSAMVFDSLVAYSEDDNKYHPLLAERWEQTDATHWRFHLRDGIKWHDGQPFSADDVVYTYRWILDPATKIRTKATFNWMADAVKVDDHTVDIVTRGPTPNILALLAYGAHILPKHVHGPLADKAAFRDNLVGTGIYKVKSLTSDGFLTLERNEAFAHGGEARAKPAIGTVTIRSMPDLGAQTAALLAGDLDVVRNLQYEEAQAISADPKYAMDISQSIAYMYVMLDTQGRSGAQALKDPRVRRAILMAIDRKGVAASRTGGKLPDRFPTQLCWDFQESCSYRETPPAYDPEGAKALLKEAGHADGLSFKIHTFTSTKDFAEAVSGYLARVGIKTEVIAQTFQAWRKSQRDGEFQVLVAAWHAGKAPDAVLAVQQFFNGDDRDMYQNAEITAVNKSLSVAPLGTARAGMIATILDAAVRDAYMVPLAGIPVVFLRSADVQMKTNRNIPYTVYLNDFSWSK
ncbi:MAG: ABC transporter substrate-binding protein [Burkholderiaceae bacterium]